jgi:predicted NACHT family NTPase
MSDLILAALPDIEAGEPVDLARIYLYAVRQKMQRDIKAERTFTSLADKLYFLCELSWEMIATDRMSLNYRLFPERLRRLFGARVAEDKDLDHWHFDMMGQTLLIRNAEGDYRPAHRSLLEFFVAYKLVAELGVLAGDFMAVAQDQSHVDELAELQDYTWNAYFQRGVDDDKEPRPIAPLRQFVAGDLTEATRLLAPALIAKAILDLALPMLNRDTMQAQLIELIQGTRNQSLQTAGYWGGNIAQLLTGADPWALESCDLHHTVMVGMNSAQVSLLQTHLAGATLDE